MDWFLYDNGLRHERVNPILLYEIENYASLGSKMKLVSHNYANANKCESESGL